MRSSSLPLQVVRFSIFEVDFRSGELRKAGVKVKLHGQPFQVLAMLLERPGDLVSRDEIRNRLWAGETFVDFNHSVNNAVTRLREALGDSAETPRFIETLPRRGYRFIGTIAASDENKAGAIAKTTSDHSVAIEGSRMHYPRIPFAVALAFVALLAALNFRTLKARLEPRTNASESARSVAVLPLVNLTGDPNQEYFVDGMTDALITNLSKLGTMRVISHTSAMHYKGTHKSLPEIARELKVGSIVEGSYARSASRVRISAQLVDASNDQSLWVRDYDRNLQDVLQLQNELATDVAEEVAGKLTQGERARLPHAQSVNFEAFEAYLRGRYFMEKWSDEALDKAVEYFQLAIQHDPKNALAYAELANSYGMMVMFSKASPAVGWQKAEAAAKEALELGKDSAEAHTALANVQAYFHCDHVSAQKEFDRAFELNANAGEVAAYHAFLLMRSGRHEEAIAEKKRSLLLDPLSPLANSELGMYLMAAGHTDEGIQQLQKTLEMDPNFSPAHARLARGYRNIGQYERAVLEFKKAIALDANTLREDDLVDVYLRWGKTTEARKMLATLIQRSKHHYVSPVRIAGFYARLGEKHAALGWLARASEDDMPDLSRPEFNGLRSDSLFRKLSERFKSAMPCSYKRSGVGPAVAFRDPE